MPSLPGVFADCAQGLEAGIGRFVSEQECADNGAYHAFEIFQVFLFSPRKRRKMEYPGMRDATPWRGPETGVV